MLGCKEKISSFHKVEMLQSLPLYNKTRNLKWNFKKAKDQSIWKIKSSVKELLDARELQIEIKDSWKLNENTTSASIRYI